MKKLLLLLILLVTIVYCENCTVEQHLLEDKGVHRSQSHQNEIFKANDKSYYRSDVPKWLLRSI